MNDEDREYLESTSFAKGCLIGVLLSVVVVTVFVGALTIFAR